MIYDSIMKVLSVILMTAVITAVGALTLVLSRLADHL